MTQVLRELVENDLLQAWVDQGRELNKDRETCAFCGSPIPEKRWAELNAHFSKESEELKQGLQALKERMERANNVLDGFLESRLYAEQNIYAAYQEDFKTAKGEWDAYINEYKAAIGRLIALIDERLANIFRPVEIGEEGIKLVDIPLIPILRKLNDLATKNNEYGKQLDEAKEKARRKLRLAYVHSFCLDINYAQEQTRITKEGANLLIAASVVGDIKKKIDALELAIKEKEKSKNDESEAARVITDLLKKHFGNGSLSLEPEEVDGGTDENGKPKAKTIFVVKRNGESAKNLSEGERSLISFCYFIAQMEDELKGEDAKKLVIFIDDPISSLDSSHIFFMYSLIDKKIVGPKKYAQVFISTHNLDFLKYLKRLSIPIEYKDHAKIEHWSHYEIVKTCRGKDDYKCEIIDMPVYLKDYVTEYNFLFEQIYKMAIPLGNNGDRSRQLEHDYTHYYSIGNNMRKFLECYLFYRYPNTDDPMKNLNKLFDGFLPSQVNRIVNEYSHLAMGARGAVVMDVPEVEMAARLIMKAVQEKDPEHFKSLCQSVKQKANVTFDV